MTRVAVIRFPGSNCDADTLSAARRAGAEAYYVWHRSADLEQPDVVILPGGFAYGDYLRAGAIARFSPVMETVQAFARSGGPVLGICNGFQVLCEAGLLPGALVRNAALKFVSRPVRVRIESDETPFTTAFQKGAIFQVPVAHGEGRYVAPPNILDDLERAGLVVMRYLENPNGSAHDIAGVASTRRNVVGMMPHPERAADEALGESAGLGVFASLMEAVPVMEGETR